jgi:hypothetical protein
MRTERRTAKLLGFPLSLVIAGGVLLSVPVEAATPTPCDMQVRVDRRSSEVYANGVERNVYDVKVTWGDKSQTAVVQRMVMPPKAQPRLVTKKLGALGQLRAQLDSPKGARGIAAVNGDFFYGYRVENDNVYLPRGASVTHGRAVRMDNVRMRVVGIDTNGDPFSGEVGVAGTVTHGSSVLHIDAVNWQTIGDGGVVVYTPDWTDVGDAARPEGSAEWVVRKNKIAQIRTGSQMGRNVKAHTKVVAFGADYARLAKRAHEGSAVSVAIRQDTTTGVQLKEAVGRGMALVRDGEVPWACAPVLNQVRPRTTVGWTSTGRWMTMSLPGTGYDRNGYRIGGLGLAQEANVAQELGFFDAVELDGGGSTTAFIRRADGDWDRVDDPDGIYQRPIPNALVWVK